MNTKKKQRAYSNIGSKKKLNTATTKKVAGGASVGAVGLNTDPILRKLGTAGLNTDPILHKTNPALGK